MIKRSRFQLDQVHRCARQAQESRRVLESLTPTTIGASRRKQPLIPSDPAFVVGDINARLMKKGIVGHSYAERYRIFLERMVAKKRYDGACFLVTHDDIKVTVR